MKTSFIKKTAIILAIQLMCEILMLACVAGYMYKNVKDSMESSVNSMLQIYGHELQNKLDNADKILERLIYKNTDYEMLQSDKESERYFASVALSRLIEESIAYDTDVDAVVIAESMYGTCLDRQNTSIIYEHRTALREHTMEAAKSGEPEPFWKVDAINGVPYIYRMYIWRGKAATVYMSVDRFMNVTADTTFDSLTVYLADKNKNLWGCYGYNSGQYETGQKMRESGGIENVFLLGDGELQLLFTINTNEIFSQIKLNMVVIAVLIIFPVIVTAIMIRFFKKEISLPMSEMRRCMGEIQNGNYEMRIENDYTSREFTMFKDTFNTLMDEIMGLKIASYEKQIELGETELKCVKLQIRPHFFLNAMTTISSLSMQNKNEDIQRYIDALSKNIRYMFHSGLHTVTLGEEINHVENYFAMQEIKYPGCVFYFIEIDDSLKSWKIPQMLIHTIIENEYKYAVSIDGMLTILIKGQLIEKDGERMLYLSLEDDGKGYPEDVVKDFESGRSEVSSNGSRVGLWSVRRMLELMYERNDLFNISNTLPHGCKNRFYIPESPLHEVKQEQSVNRID